MQSMHDDYFGGFGAQASTQKVFTKKKKKKILQRTWQGIFLFPFISLANLSTKDYEIKKEEQKCKNMFAYFPISLLFSNYKWGSRIQRHN